MHGSARLGAGSDHLFSIDNVDDLFAQELAPKRAARRRRLLQEIHFHFVLARENQRHRNSYVHLN